MNNPIIAYDNAITIENIGTNDNDIAVRANATTTNISEFWKVDGNSNNMVELEITLGQDVDCFGFVLCNAQAVLVQEVFSPTSTQNIAFHHINNEKVVFLIFYRTVVSGATLRIRFTVPSGVLFRCAYLFLGTYYQFPFGIDFGFVPPSLAKNNKLIGSTSENNSLVGRLAVERCFETTVGWQYLTEQVYTTHIVPFLNFAETQNFFFCWDSSKNPQDNSFCYINTKKSIRPKITEGMLYSIKFTIAGITA